MKQFQRQLLIAIYLLKYIYANFTNTDLAQITETPLSCSIDNCTECPNNSGGTASCTRCQLGYFLYQIPQTFDPDQGYTFEQFICVQCPHYSDATISYIPCGDCVDNPGLWAEKRICTYYYTIDAPTQAARNLSTDAIMRISQSQSTLFEISIQLSGTTYTSSVQECFGCLKFCGNSVLEQGCNLFSSPPTTDTYQKAVICRETYFWDKNSCNNKCTADGSCKKCKKVNNAPICVVCIDGYALDRNGSCVECSTSITNCQKCYYGDDSGRNFSQDPINFVGKPLPPNTYLRCSNCALSQTNQAGGNTIVTVQIDVQLIPSLDLKSCVSCPTNCVRCDYSTTQNGMDIHSKNPRIIPTAQQSSYQLRCRVCKSGYVLNPNGQCEACNIANCSKCAYGNPNPQSYYTLNVNNFSIQDSVILPANNFNGNVLFCAVCNKGFNRKLDGTCDNSVPAQCHSSVNGNCLICDDGKIADQTNCSNPGPSDTTMTNCGQYYKATSGGQSKTYCLSCVNYDGPQNVSNGYPNYNTGYCDSCDSTGVCSQCTQWNWRFNLIDYFQFQRPYLTSNQFSTYTDTLQLEPTAWCLECNPPNLLEPWTGQCFGCLGTCDGCSGKFGLPNCSKCNLSSTTITSGLTAKRSQNMSKIGCHLCSDYEQNCVELDSTEKKIKNPYYSTSVQFGSKVRWTKANQCRIVSGDIDVSVPYYSGRFMFFNSYNQKCLVCQTNTGCKKKVVIPYFIDNVMNTNQDISAYYPATKFTGYNAYSLPYLSSQKLNTINFNLREALEFSDVYVKFAEEGVEEIEFQIIFVGNSQDVTYLTDSSVDFNFQFVSEALSMIPTLLNLKATVNTMIKGDFTSIGQKKMKIYLKDSIIFSQFSSVEFNNIEIYPIENKDSNAEKNPFFIKLVNNLLTTSVTFSNCKIGNTNSLNAQYNDYSEKGTSQYFVLISPNLISLTLNNFVIDQIYYPPQQNFYDPGTQNLAFSAVLSNVQFTGLSFSYTSVFSMNNTHSKMTLNQVTIKGTSFDNSYFIKELDGLKDSYLRFDLNNMVFDSLTLSDSFLIYVMNAVRFKAYKWDFIGPFSAESVSKITSVICTNLISISKVTVTSDPVNTFYLNTVSLFSTPSYSLTIQQELQINHRYSDISIDKVKCNLAANSDSLGVYTCFFDLKAPYNPHNYLLNVKMSSVTISNTYTDQTQLQLQWKLISMSLIDSLEMDTFSLLKNQKFQGVHIYNPVTFSVENFVCGDPDDTNYQANILFTGMTNQLDQSKLHGYCISAVFCQESLSFKSIFLKNYSGYMQSPFQIICTKDIKDQQKTGAYIPITIDDFEVSKSVIFFDDPNKQVSVLQIQNDYKYDININDIYVKLSQISPINGVTSTSFSSSTVLLIDSISSYLTLTNSMILDTTCLFSQNAVAVVVDKFTVTNCLFRNGNQGQDTALLQTQGGFVNARASQMNFIDITLETSIANQGSGLYLRTITPGAISISGKSKFYDLKSSTNIFMDGNGGAIYIDSRDSMMTLVIDGVTFLDIFARTVGGVLYVDSGSDKSDITITNCLIKDVYAPQGSLIYAQQINSNSQITLNNNIIEWSEQDTIYSYLTSTLVTGTGPPDPLLVQALQEHSQIWISKGKLTTTNNVFQGLRYQKLLALYQLNSWEDTGSSIDGYLMSTYPLIYTYKTSVIKLTNTIISNISPYQHSDGIPFFDFVEQDQRDSVIEHSSDVDITYTGVKITNNRSKTKYGFAKFQQWSGLLTITGGDFNYNIGEVGVIFLSQSSSSSSSRLLLQEEIENDTVLCSNFTSKIESQTTQRLLLATDTTAVITNSNFNGNYATQGAALNSYSVTLTISGATFSNNYATGVGGAIYSYQPSTSTNTIVFSGVTFSNNLAGSGGAYQILGISPTLSTIVTNTFTSNTATFYGQNKVESPVAIRLLYNGKVYSFNKGDTTTPTISFYGSGQNPGGLIAQLVGSDGKILRQQTDTLKVSLNFANGETVDSTVKISGNTVFNFDETVGGYNLTSLIFIAKPPNQVKVKFSSSAVRIPIKDNTGTITSYDTSYIFPLVVKMRECIEGEIYEATTGQCYACPVTKYSLIVGSEACISCPKIGVDKCPGYNIMEISAGYWRKNTSSDLIQSCSNLESNCLGGSGTQLCYEGHIGALCEECDLYGEQWGESYALSGSYTCGKCSEISGNAQKVAIIIIWTLITTLLSVKSTIKQVQEYIMSQILTVAGFTLAGKSSNSKNQAGVLIKILTSYFQVISVLFTFKLTIPSFFSTTTDAIGNPSQQMSVSMDCFFLKMSDIHVTYFRLIWQLINPLLFIAAAIIAYVVGVTIKKVRKNIGYIWCTFIFLFITLQPSIILAFISTASCRKIAEVNYIKANVALECYTSQHNLYLGVLIVPSLLVWVLIIPILFFVKLYRSRTKIYSNIWIRYRYGYLYMEYHPRAYFWEFIKMFEKITLIIIINVYDNDTKVKGVLCFLTVVIYLILSYIFKPYLENEQNRLDQRGNEACAISMIMGVFIYQNSYDYLIYTGYIILLFVNLLFVFDIVRGLMRGYTKKLDDFINNQHEKIVKILAKFPRIQKLIIKKHTAYVPLQRINFLWKRTSKYVHKFFEERKKDPTFQFFDTVLDPAAQKIFVKDIQKEDDADDEKKQLNLINVAGGFRKSNFAILNLFSNNTDQDNATLYSSGSPNYSPQIEPSNSLLNPNVVKIRSLQQGSSQLNYDSIQEDEFNLADTNDKKPLNKIPINLTQGDDTPTRIKLIQGSDTPTRKRNSQAGSIKSFQNKRGMQVKNLNQEKQDDGSSNNNDDFDI